MKKYDLEIIIGLDCNNNCIFCSNQSLRKLYKEKEIFSLSLNKIENILDSHDSKTIDTLFLVGGEPTIFKNFFKIIKSARTMGYSNITIVTNGRMFKNINFAKKICKTKINVIFSVHSHIAQIHNKLTRSPMCFEQLVAGINNIKSLGYSFSTNTVINKMNYKQIPEIINFLSKYNPSSMLFSLVNPAGIPEEKLKNILPCPNSLNNIIGKSVSTAKRLNQNIKFIDIPLCIMKEYKNYMHENDFKHDRKIIIKGTKEFFHSKNKNENEKMKPLICSTCKKNKDCFGIWKKYIKFYGDKGLYPISDTVIDENKYK